MRATFYITPALFGAFAYVLMEPFIKTGIATLLSFFIILVLRFGAIKGNWMLPSFFFFEKVKNYDDED
jgi:uncharacterized membrane protein YeiH